MWQLKEQRYIATVEDLRKKMTQGTTVDQGSSSEMQLGDFLKKIFNDKNDKIAEYAKGVAGGDWLQEIKEDDNILDFGKFIIVIDSMSKPYIEGSTLDFHKEAFNQNIKIANPNVEMACGCGVSVTFK